MTAVDERLLLEIIEGCEGVTPGPWAIEPHVSYMDADYAQINGKGWGWFARVCVRVDGAPSKGGEANAAHIARLDPQTVHALATELLAARKEIAGLREGLAKAERRAEMEANK